MSHKRLRHTLPLLLPFSPSLRKLDILTPIICQGTVSTERRLQRAAEVVHIGNAVLGSAEEDYRQGQDMREARMNEEEDDEVTQGRGKKRRKRKARKDARPESKESRRRGKDGERKDERDGDMGPSGGVAAA